MIIFEIVLWVGEHVRLLRRYGLLQPVSRRLPVLLQRGRLFLLEIRLLQSFEIHLLLRCFEVRSGACLAVLGDCGVPQDTASLHRFGIIQYFQIAAVRQLAFVGILREQVDLGGLGQCGHFPCPRILQNLLLTGWTRALLHFGLLLTLKLFWRQHRVFRSHVVLLCLLRGRLELSCGLSDVQIFRIIIFLEWIVLRADGGVCLGYWVESIRPLLFGICPVIADFFQLLLLLLFLLSLVQGLLHAIPAANDVEVEVEMLLDLLF